MTKHIDAHPLSGQAVTLATGEFAGQTYVIEDWWDRIAGQSWMDCDGNPACLEYAVRSHAEGDPISNDVVYGKVGSNGKLVHVRHFQEAEAVHG